ncbi:MAG: hypothetical protein HY042_11355, partial [Spirochaetia bacterium]|nr:hypothetical protein [Spirochaetia bacterium]
PLRLDLLRSDPLPPAPLYDPSTSALVFSGCWVDVPGPHNERFPPFSRKETDIEDWVDNAFPWTWEDLPKSVLENNAALLDHIERQLRKPSR